MPCFLKSGWKNESENINIVKYCCTKVVIMFQKIISSFFILIALFIISGCVDIPQTQAEKVGWDTAKYEDYSVIYDLKQDYKLPILTMGWYHSKNITAHHQMKAADLQLLLIEIPQNGSQFDKTWYVAFSYYSHGLLAEASSYENQVINYGSGYISDTEQARQWRSKAAAET